MNLRTISDIREVMAAPFPSAALNAAIELGLFWRMADGPRSSAEISREMNIPPKRCGYWLRLLAGMNLLQQEGDRFGLSPLARSGILDVHSQETWKMLAIDALDSFENGLFLAQRLSRSNTDRGDGEHLRHHLPLYVQKMEADLERTRLFTQMLFELHSPLAQNIADALDLNGINSLLDVGGGSGVVSFALLRRHPELRALVVDIPNVCTAGREIADKMPERDRISYYAADLVRDELPKGFDIVLACDVGRFDNPFLAKLSASLNEGGRLVIVDRWFDMGPNETPVRLAYLLNESLRDPEFSLRRVEEIEDGLVRAGLEVAPSVELPYGRWKLIQAKKTPATRGDKGA